MRSVSDAPARRNASDGITTRGPIHIDEVAGEHQVRHNGSMTKSPAMVLHPTPTTRRSACPDGSSLKVMPAGSAHRQPAWVRTQVGESSRASGAVPTAVRRPAQRRSPYAGRPRCDVVVRQHFRTGKPATRRIRRCSSAAECRPSNNRCCAVWEPARPQAVQDDHSSAPTSI